MKRVTCQNMDTKRPTEWHSQAREDRGRNLSGHERKQLGECHLLSGDSRERDLSRHERTVTR